MGIEKVSKSLRQNSEHVDSFTDQSTGIGVQKIFLTTVEETHIVGAKLARAWLATKRKLQDQSNNKKILPIFLLTGDLGTGKTNLVKGIGQSLGINEPITSPSFALAQHYKGHVAGQPTALVHVDLYRLENQETADELFAQEEEEAHLMRALLAVEWPERLSFTPKNSWKLQLNFGHEKFINTKRELIISTT